MIHIADMKLRTGSTDTEDLLAQLLNTQLAPAQQLLLTLAHGYEPVNDTLLTPCLPTLTSTPDLGMLSELLQVVDMDEQGDRQPNTVRDEPPAHATDSDIPVKQMLPRNSNNIENMLRRVLELNCFSDTAMDPGYELGRQLAVTASQEQNSADADVHNCSKLSACNFLALAAKNKDKEPGRRLLSRSQRPSPKKQQGQGGLNADDVVGEPHIGLWVEHAWMNHSCAPNVVNYVLGDAMVVRAGHDLPAGTELQDTYLGNVLHQPLQARRQQLLESYGFTCQCRRCVAEEKLQETSPAAAALLVSLHQRCCDEWEPRARHLLTSQPRAVQPSASSNRRHARVRLSAPTQTELKARKQQVYRHCQRWRSLLQSHRFENINSRAARTMWLSRLRLQGHGGTCTIRWKSVTQQTQDAPAGGRGVSDELIALTAEMTEQLDGVEQLLSATYGGSSEQNSNINTNSKEQGRMLGPAMFPLFGCYELMTLCLQHVVSSQQPGSGSGHETYEKILAAASKAATLAHLTVPGTDLHVGAVTSAWIAIASWMDHMDSNSKQGSVEELYLQLARQQQKLKDALTIRYGSLEVQSDSRHGQNTADDCFQALVQARL